MDSLIANDGRLQDIAAAGRITANDVMDLRRRIFGDGVVSLEDADAVFRLDRQCADKDPSWTRFYVEALGDHFVWQSEPRGYLTDEQAQRLLDSSLRNRHIDNTTDLELLIYVVDRATRVPEELVLHVLDAVRESVLTPETAAYGSNRPPAVVTPADVAIIRKVIHAPGGHGSLTVTRREAEMVFDLNDATRGEDNAPEWQDLFVKAIANHLMFPRPAPDLPDAEEAMRRQAWLEKGPAPGSFLAGIGKAFARADVPFAEAWRELDPFGYEQARAEQEAEDRRTREALAREAIDAEEARWLVGRIMNSGAIDANERALLAFIRENSPRIDPALQPLFDEAGL